MNNILKKIVLVIILAFLFFAYSIAEDRETATEKLSTIVFAKPLYEINRIPFSFYFSVNDPIELQAQKELQKQEISLPYYDESQNPYDSITFVYNEKNKLTLIRYHRRNTIQTDSIIYDKNEKLLQCFSYSDKENPNFETKQTIFKYEKDSIFQYENDVWKKTYKIDSSNRVLELRTNGYYHIYEYNPNKTIKKIITKEIIYKSVFERVVTYDEKRQSQFVFGNTPQWFCLTNKFLFMFDSYVDKMYNPETKYLTFNVIYAQENLNNTESILIEKLYRNETHITTNEYNLKYTPGLP